MGWEPGQKLGKNDNGILIPIKAVGTNRCQNEGLGYSILKIKEMQVAELIVEVLKLKMEQNPVKILKCSVPTIESVFEEDSQKNETKDYRSEISIKVFEYEIDGLIDTGSDLTCISEDFWLELESKRKGTIQLMPIKPIQIRTAVGHKSMDIKNSVLLPLRLGSLVIDTLLLIVPKLVNHIILGFDWLKLNEISISIEQQVGGLVINRNDNKYLIKFRELEKQTVDNSAIEREGSHCETNEEIQEINTGENIDIEQKQKLMNLLSQFEGLFSSKLGKANCYQHNIQMNSETPIIKKTYPVPYAYRERIEAKLKEMEEQGIISRASTPYCSPLTFTLKRDGTIRVLLDAREINKHMIPETEKPPLQMDVLNSFHGANYISVVDMNNAYFQIPITEESKRYTGFTFNGKSYVYNVLPQGLKTSVGSFSRAIDIILGHEVRDFCVNYLDDLAIVTTGSFDLHLEHLTTVLDRLQGAGLTCNLKKCKFVCKEIKMLGFILSTKGLCTDPEKVQAVQNFPVPRKLKQLRAFLGLCNFYRRFVPEYSVHIQPLCELLKKGKIWNWEEKEQKAFENVKSLFIKTILLHHPNFSKPYFLQTDASGVGLAGVLYQFDDTGETMIIGFHSKALTEAQKNWTVTEQEFFSIISCLRKFETYLRGAKVIIKTDHKALMFVKNWKLYNARVTRWMNYLENFQYEVQHIKGSENIVPDILSRYPPQSDHLQEEKERLPGILYMMVPKENRRLLSELENMSMLQKEDAEIRVILDQLEQLHHNKKQLEGVLKRYKVINNVLCIQKEKIDKYVIHLPEKLRDKVIKLVHLEMGHQGAYKVIKYVKDRFYWKGLSQQVKRVTKSCHDCQMTKHENKTYVGPCCSIITKEIGDIVMVDLYGPLPTGLFGMNYIFVVQDSFSKFVRFYELRRATAGAVIGRMKKYFSVIKPKVIMSDNGSQFASKQWKEFMTQNDVKVIYTTVRNPRPNIVERVNRELGRLFRSYCRHNHKGWVTIVPKLEELYNNTYHESTGFTPCEIMYGESTLLSFDKIIGNERHNMEVQKIREAVRENLERAGQYRRGKFNQKYRLRQFQIGDLVKIRKLNKSDAKQKITKKFEALYEGPYVVASNPYQNVYILINPQNKKIRGKFNTIHLSKYYK